MTETLTQPRKTRYAIVGTGGRCEMFRDALNTDFSAHGEIVGFCDVNRGRLLRYQEETRKATGRVVPIFDLAANPDGFDEMVRRTQPDVVIVTSIDRFHHQYIVGAMELGCDAISEKPMTMDADKCQKIIDTQARTGRRCRVTFNYRYSPPRVQVKDLLMSGIIGDIVSVDFHWMLDTHHGADYFRRWHSNKQNSGGLMVHKATHHFDLVNWWLSSVPVSVFATGKRQFYTPETARRMGLRSHHERCRTCPEKDACGFYFDLGQHPLIRALYLDCEEFDGYFRDRCVFRPEISIEDTMHVQVRYANDATMSYSLVAHAAWEGYTLAFNGTQGRLEHKCEESIYVSGDGTVPGALVGDGTYIRIFPLRKPAYEVPIWQSEGGHGGGDKPLLEDLFLPARPADPYLRAADHRSGAYSILTGVAANRSMETGAPVEIASLVRGLQSPDFPPMPDRRKKLAMP